MCHLSAVSKQSSLFLSRLDWPNATVFLKIFILTQYLLTLVKFNCDSKGYAKCIPCALYLCPLAVHSGTLYQMCAVVVFTFVYLPLYLR